MTRASTGVPGLDAIIDDLRVGDNVVWQVDSEADFAAVAEPFVGRALAEGRRVLYLSFGQRPPLPAPVPAGELAAAHHSLSQELIHTLNDLDELLRDGEARATAALAQVRQHLLGRTARDFQTHLVNPGSLAGRD